MHINAFDRYENYQSHIHQLDPRVKTVITILFILSNALLPDGVWLAFVVAWGFILTLERVARLPLGYTFKRSFIILPFLFAAITVVFTIPGEILSTWQVGSRTITVTDAGLVRFASIVIRSWLSVQMAILLTATTQFPDLMHALQHLRVPYILIAIISFMYRYLFVMVDEASRLVRAREARSAQFGGNHGGGTLFWRAKVAGYMVGQLFVRSFARSDRVYNAMLSRGYDGRLLTINPHHMHRKDWLSGGISLLIITLIQGIGHFWL